LKVAQKEGLVLVDGEAERRVERLKVDSTIAQSSAADLAADSISNVDEFGGLGGGESEAYGAQHAAPSDC
jgi:hypothetical protein